MSAKRILLTFIVITFLLLSWQKHQVQAKRDNWWEFQSIDTVKYSRDISREKLDSLNFNLVIDSQVKAIAASGATHVAIGTPYDEEFIPILRLWVGAARKYKLAVWFRGNFSGWEQWFGYSKITREEHIKKTKEFIRSHEDLFDDGDIFNACTECENGGPGDPRKNGDVKGHREFLIAEYQEAKETFSKIGKQVLANFNSMNGDVARLVMDRETTKALDGLVVIDHYVKDSDKMVRDIKQIAQDSGGEVVLGEFGAPIPDIHGNMNADEQSAWLEDTLNKLSQVEELVGLNYWVSFGGSSKLWEDNGRPRAAFHVISSYYKTRITTGIVKNEIRQPISLAKISFRNRQVQSGKKGDFQLPVVGKDPAILIEAQSYNSQTVTIADNQNNYNIILIKTKESIFFRILKLISRLLSSKQT